MSEGSDSDALTRRTFCQGALTVACVAAVAGCEGPASTAEPSDEPSPTPSPFDAHTTALLSAVMGTLIPGASGRAGAVEAGAPAYLVQLLSAFESDPPRIFAGGPYSGRHGGLDGFSRFQKLTRVEELRWRTAIEGSQGIPEREFDGPVLGLRERYEQGLHAIDELAGGRFLELDAKERAAVLQKADDAFVALVYEHANEGTYGDPVYGGNLDRKGWLAIDYEGDRQPRGYSARELLHPEEG